MKKNKFIVLVDMDDVLENLQEAWIKRLNQKYCRNVDGNTVKDWNVGLYYPNLTRDEVLSPLYEDNFWTSVKPKEDAIFYLKKLYDEGFSIFIVTSSHYATLVNKFEQALFPYYPFIDMDHIIICSNKQLIKGHVLIDDGAHNLIDSEITTADYYKVLFTANPNIDFDTIKHGIKRVSNWHEVYSIVERLYEIENELEKMSTKQIEIG